jgi:transcriptional regulator with XRE-family HTH domain
LDVSYQSRDFVVTWLSPDRFTVSSVSEHTAYGEGPDEFYTHVDAARERVATLLSGKEETVPPLPTLLSRVRETRGLTQSDLAKKLGLSQATISGIENRKDLQLSTLRKIVEALGGTLQITARFDDALYALTTQSEESIGVPAATSSTGDASSRRPPPSFPALERRGAVRQSRRISQRVRIGGLWA